MYTRLPEVTAGFTKPLEIWEFWLNEAMAQLQLALLGETKQTEAKTNKMLRNAFGEALFGGGSETDVATRLQSQVNILVLRPWPPVFFSFVLSSSNGHGCFRPKRLSLSWTTRPTW